MGHWTIVVHGHGPHHNRDFGGDANVQARELVDHLGKHHAIFSAMFISSKGLKILAPAPADAVRVSALSPRCCGDREGGRMSEGDDGNRSTGG